MVKADVGDDGEVGADDIGAVETSAKPDFDDGYIDLLFCKVEEGKGCGKFEEGGVQWLEETSVVSDEVDDKIFTDGSAIDADALSEVDEVG